jgi:nucleoid DNA-binding protein
MNKAELIAHIADSVGCPKTQANAALDAFIEAVTKSLKKGDKVTLVGFVLSQYLSVLQELVVTHKQVRLSRSKQRKLHVSRQVKN